MSRLAREWAWTMVETLGLPAARGFVLVALGDFCNDTWGYACPSMARLGRRCGMTAGQARRHVGELERLGLVVVDRATRDRGDWRSNRYVRRVDASAARVPTDAHPQEGVLASTPIGTVVDARGTGTGARTY
jgi:DNA-binding MarR family transcriptional regulator